MQDSFFRLFQGIMFLGDTISKSALLLERCSQRRDDADQRVATGVLYAGIREFRELLPILRTYANSVSAGPGHQAPSSSTPVGVFRRALGKRCLYSLRVFVVWRKLTPCELLHEQSLH